MKKKILCFVVMAFSLVAFCACGSKKIELKDYLIEERNNLFTAQDDTYSVTFSSGMREENYNLDGQINNMVDFGVLTLSRLDHNPLAITECTYLLTLDDQIYTGELKQSEFDNTFSTDIGAKASNTSTISVQLKFDGVTFDAQMANTTGEFTVDTNAALKIANKELKNELQNFSKDKNNFEVVMKIVKDYSNADVKDYYWYIGVVSKNGNTLGILIDANSGDVIAKKV